MAGYPRGQEDKKKPMHQRETKLGRQGQWDSGPQRARNRALKPESTAQHSTAQHSSAETERPGGGHSARSTRKLRGAAGGITGGTYGAESELQGRQGERGRPKLAGRASQPLGGGHTLIEGLHTHSGSSGVSTRGWNGKRGPTKGGSRGT